MTCEGQREPPADTFPKTQFWDFSVDLYAVPGVQEDCLALQEALSLDVNIILLCLWSAAARGEHLSKAQLQQIVTQAREWNAGVVVPLRQARRQMKKGLASVPNETIRTVRGRLASVEIDCEHIEQLMIQALIGDGGLRSSEPVAVTARLNLALYLGILAVTPGQSEADAIARLATAAGHMGIARTTDPA